jgi:TolA-binding protein
MVFSWRWLLVALVLGLSCERNFAAGSTKEDRDYAAAVWAFKDGDFARAESEFAQFADTYKTSTHVAEAVLMQAEAQFKQGKFTNSITLLKSGKATAGFLADQYESWIGEAQFASSNFLAAAETFSRLANNPADAALGLRSVVNAASAYSQIPDWPKVVALLQETNGVFQRALSADAGNELVVRGQLLLARAKHELGDFASAFVILKSLNLLAISPELGQQGLNLLYQDRFTAGDYESALAAATNLLQIPQVIKDGQSRAEGVALRAGALEKLNRDTEAIAAYRENLLATNAPGERQRQAVLKITELAIKQNQLTNAEQSLDAFLKQFTNSPAADIALLTLGELHLKDYVAQPSATNHLTQATAAFDQFLGAFSNSPLAGKAYLDQGWCYWLLGKIPDSVDAFQSATQRLPPSEDLAVARFKLGDGLFALTNYAGALTNYRAVLEDFAGYSSISNSLRVPALYQTLRGSLKLNDMTAATNALGQILKLSPVGELADSGVLLVGQGLTDFRRPAAARELLQQFKEASTDSAWLLQVELAIARTYEQDGNWPAAILKYEDWLDIYTNHPARPQVDYALAWANFQAGNETNAFIQFTNLVAQFPTNDLALPAQWWVADHFFRAGNYTEAEKNYQYVFQNWPASDLAFEARLMAGRAAMGRFNYSDAIRYFTNATLDAASPAVKVRAAFAYGSALMLLDSTETNNPLANFSAATNVFGQICRAYPTNEWGAQAWGELGDCYLQLGNFDAATNAYAQVFSTNSPAALAAGIAARSQAQIGFGIALEKKAALANVDEQTSLLKSALDNYQDVFYTTNLRDDELADSLWLKKAGLQALPLFESLGLAYPTNFIDRMETNLPQLKNLLDKKRAALSAGK